MALALPDRSAKPSPIGWIVGLLVATILAIGLGGALGVYTTSTVRKTIEEQIREPAKSYSPTAAVPADVVVKALGPVITNLGGSGSDWIRIETSILIGQKAENPDRIAAEIKQDMLAYLRTVSLSQIEGPSGLQALLEDLNERAAIRSKGVVKQLIIETFVVQ